MRRPPADSTTADNPWNEVLQLERASTPVETRFGDAKRIVWRRWGTGPALVLFHGGGGSWTHWLRTLPALIPHYTVWAVDLPGYGDSDRPDPPYSYASIAGLLADGMEQLLPRGERFDLVAFSFGAYIAMPLANRFPERIRRLVLAGINIVGHVNPPPYLNWKKAGTESERDAMIRQNMLTAMLHDPARLDADAFAMRLQMDNLARHRLSTPTLKGLRKLRDSIQDLPQGIQLAGINGENDFLVRDQLERQAEAFRNFRGGAPFRVIAGASHWVMYDAPDEFNRALLDILSS